MFDRIALIALIALTVLLVVSLWFLCSEVFSAFGIVFTICFSKSEQSMTQFTSLMNHIPGLSIYSQSPSGPRRNSLHSWITHPHLIIHQDPSAKPAELSRVTSRPPTLPQVEANVDVLRVRPTMPNWPSSHRLPAAPLGSFLIELWVHSSCSTTTDLKRRWSANSLLSMCSSIPAQRLIETCRTSSLKIASADGWESNIQVVVRGKKGRSGGKIKPRERSAEFEVSKILA